MSLRAMRERGKKDKEWLSMVEERQKNKKKTT